MVGVFKTAAFSTTIGGKGCNLTARLPGFGWWEQTTPILAGLAVGVAAYAGKAVVEMATKLRSAPRMRQFYKVVRSPRLNVPTFCFCHGYLRVCTSRLFAAFKCRVVPAYV